MEPRIEYATTDDEVSIGFATLGEGPPTVVAPADPISQVLTTWQVPAWLGFYRRLAQHRQLVLYDGRGTGVSDREVTDYSLDAQVLDLSGVVERLGLGPFALFAPLSSGPSAITYAAAHPERVSRLVLWCAYADASDYLDLPAWRTLYDLMTANWELFVQTVSHARFGSDGHESPDVAGVLRTSITPEMMQAHPDGLRGVDVTSRLSDVKTATLVLHRRDLHVGPSVNVAKRLASRIPNARLAILEGTSVAPYQGDVDPVLAAIDEFVGVATPVPSSRTSATPASQELAEPLSGRELQVLQLIAATLAAAGVAIVGSLVALALMPDKDKAEAPDAEQGNSVPTDLVPEAGD